MMHRCFFSYVGSIAARMQFRQLVYSHSAGREGGRMGGWEMGDGAMDDFHWAALVVFVSLECVKRRVAMMCRFVSAAWRQSEVEGAQALGHRRGLADGVYGYDQVVVVLGGVAQAVRQARGLQGRTRHVRRGDVAAHLL